MAQLPLLRWGRTYESLDTSPLTDFQTGEAIAELGLATAGLVHRDLRYANRARDVLRDFSDEKLLACLRQAAERYRNEEIDLFGCMQQTPEDFIRHQSATTGLPHRLCRANMEKNYFVLTHMGEILDALTRGVDRGVFRTGYVRQANGVVVSFQAQSPVLGAVLPNNSPGVHTLWLPAVAMAIGLVLKPGSQEPWTPYRLIKAMIDSGLPPEAFAIYPGAPDVSNAVLTGTRRALVFGGAETVERYRGNPSVQVHGPGFSKIIVCEDVVDRWEEYLDLFVESVASNGGRSCINCSSIWVPRHGAEIADALAQRLAAIDVLPPDHPDALLAAFTNPEIARNINKFIDSALTSPDNEDFSARYRSGPRLEDRQSHTYLRPTVIFCKNPDAPLANQEFLFPFVSVVQCPQEEILDAIGPTLVCTVITESAEWRRRFLDCTQIDRLNLGPIPTSRVDWRQPHEGNLFEFLYRHRALQVGD